MAEVKFQRSSPQSHMNLFLINNVLVELNWAEIKYPQSERGGIENLRRFVNLIEMALGNYDLDEFINVIQEFVATRGTALYIATKVFPDKFKQLITNICNHLYNSKEKVTPFKVYRQFAKNTKVLHEHLVVSEFSVLLNDTVRNFREGKIEELRAALLSCDREKVNKIKSTFVNMRAFLEYVTSIIRVEFIVYIRKCGEEVVEQRGMIYRKSLWVYALQFHTFASPHNAHIEGHDIVNQTISEIVKTISLKTQRNMYKFSDDIWKLTKMDIDLPRVSTLTWHSLQGPVKIELKRYIHNCYKIGENIDNLLRRYRNIIMMIKPFQDLKYDDVNSFLDINSKHAEHLLDHMQHIKKSNGRQRFKMKTIQGGISECRLVYDWLSTQNKMKEINNPFRMIKMYNVNAFIENALYIPEEVVDQLKEKILELPEYIQYLWVIMMNTGLRVSEVLALEENCLSFKSEDQTYYLSYIPHKSLKHRRKLGLDDYKLIPILDSEVVSYIKQQISNTLELRKNGSTNKIFIKACKHIGISLYGKTSIANQINKLIKKHGIMDVNGSLWHYTHHQCRKTLAVNLFTAGASVDQVGDILSHLDKKATLLHYHDVELIKIAELDQGLFEAMFDNMDPEVAKAYSAEEIKDLKREIKLGARETPEGHGICSKHVSFGPCKKKSCVGCPMLLTGPQKLPMWRKLYREQKEYMEKLIHHMKLQGIHDYEEFRDYQAEFHLLQLYKATIEKLETLVKERMTPDEQQKYLDC